jgi:CPA2 family monovalent cation:H+ antiporter-2
VKLEEISALNAEVQGHVVICGYGRVGQSIGRILHKARQPYIALDNDPVRVREGRRGRKRCALRRLSSWRATRRRGLERASLVVIAVDKAEVALQVVKEARRINPHVPILRTRDDSQSPELKAAGASEVVPELLESSLMLASHALIMLGFLSARSSTVSLRYGMTAIACCMGSIPVPKTRSFEHAS